MTTRSHPARAVAKKCDPGGSSPRHHVRDDDAIYAALTPLLSARSSGRIWTGTGYDRSRRLGRFKVPDMPVAVYLYSGGWTRILVFDLDAKVHGPDSVIRDAQWLRHIVETAGGVVVEDVNPGSGGRHLYVPLAEQLRVEHIRTLLSAIQPFCRTLDPTPMLNCATGCIVPPGSWTKEGQRRQLVGAVSEAIELLSRRSDRGLVARLRAALGAGIAAQARERSTIPTEGVGASRRLPAEVVFHTALPQHVTAFAIEGTMPRGFWNTRSEACQAVLYACAVRGWSLNEVVDQLDRGAWPALAAVYSEKKRTTAEALAPQWDRAFAHAVEITDKHRSRAHTKQHTGGLIHSGVHRDWLAHSRKWAQLEYRGSRHLHVVLAVLQALAVDAARAGQLVNGVPTVETGRRGLAIAAGLIPDRTIGDVLMELRERPGSPILRMRPATGVLADQYALVTPATGAGDERQLIIEDDPIRRDRARVEPVHPIWRLVGLHLKQAYELIVHAGLRTPADVFAAAQLGASAGSETLNSLASLGLITRSYGRCEPGTRTLDDLSAAHGLDEVRLDTIERHRRERAEWHAWLELKGHIAVDDPALLEVTAARVPTPPPGWEISDKEALWAALMADGPPTDQPEHIGVVEEAVGLLMDELGATILVP
ncbi:MAG: hypothetical protein LLG14_22580 [Nocardiaceae bacterium]|nr:hypothetical protein [Nocardiaceae bacterium]